MACASLVALPRACGAEGVLGGSEKLYMIAHKDLVVVSGTTVYTTASNGTVNEIGLASGKTFVEIGLLKSTAGLNLEYTNNPQTGSSYFTNTLTTVLAGMSVENRAFVDSVKNQPVVALLKTRTGKYFVTGLNGQFEVSAITGGTGVAEGDLNGYNLTFSGIDGFQPFLVDESIIDDLITA
jgi:hypothetical protein